MQIPVWHDDQQGTATVLLAGLIGALKVVGKELAHIKIAMIGMGAANVATYRILISNGVHPEAIMACDSQGTLHSKRHDLETRRGEFPDKWRICTESNVENVQGGIAEALRGADVCVAFAASGPGIIRPEWVRQMAPRAIVFACANPTPEIWPWEAKQAGAQIAATGRGDFPNQVNNSLAFPGIFRGALDVRAKTITDEMAIAAAHELARVAEEKGLNEDYIVPRMDDWDICPRVAVATAMQAQLQGVACLCRSKSELFDEAMQRVKRSRNINEVLYHNHAIPLPPPRP